LQTYPYFYWSIAQIQLSFSDHAPNIPINFFDVPLASADCGATIVN
jgi:hypothetical protein